MQLEFDPSKTCARFGKPGNRNSWKKHSDIVIFVSLKHFCFRSNLKRKKIVEIDMEIDFSKTSSINLRHIENHVNFTTNIKKYFQKLFPLIFIGSEKSAVRISRSFPFPQICEISSL